MTAEKKAEHALKKTTSEIKLGEFIIIFQRREETEMSKYSLNFKKKKIDKSLKFFKVDFKTEVSGEWKDRPHTGRKTFVKDISHKESLFKIQKELLKLKNRKKKKTNSI